MTVTHWDAILVGGGHNGLTAATILARAGLKVAVLERQAHLGGLAAAQEFSPGFRSSGLLHDTSLVRQSVVELLDLRNHGLKLRDAAPAVLCPSQGGEDLILSPEASQRRLGAHEGSYQAWRGFMEKITPAVARLLNSAPPEFSGENPADLLKMASTGLAVRTLGAEVMMDLLRGSTLPARDWLDEWIRSDHLKACLTLPALEGAFMGPWSPGSASLVMAREAVRGAGVHGGPAALAQALVAAAQSQGVTLRTQAAVRQIVVERGAVRGVLLEDGQRLEAPLVALSCDPRRGLLELVPTRHLPLRTADALRAWRTRGTVAKVHLGIKGPLLFDGHGARQFARIRVAPSQELVERAFDAAKHGELPQAPALDICVPTLENPLLAPEGHHIVSVLVYFVPYRQGARQEAAWNQALGDLVIQTLERYAPGLSGQVVARQVLTPNDLEAQHGLTGGHLYHGEHAMDQLSVLRPSVDCGHYRTPLEGLYLCGSGAHPGGGITCAPGALAAAAILKQQAQGQA